MGLQSTWEMKIPGRLAGSPPMKMGCEPYRGRGQLRAGRGIRLEDV